MNRVRSRLIINLGIHLKQIEQYSYAIKNHLFNHHGLRRPMPPCPADGLGGDEGGGGVNLSTDFGYKRGLSKFPAWPYVSLGKAF